MQDRNVNKFLVDFLTHCSGDNFRKWKTIAQQRDVHELHDEYQLALDFEEADKSAQYFQHLASVWTKVPGYHPDDDDDLPF
jgi:hypothetical protein|tara:strand:- start:525 stop:767 length:243 start_codon:yes stop_codon:yes gene_type:complete